MEWSDGEGGGSNGARSPGLVFARVHSWVLAVVRCPFVFVRGRSSRGRLRSWAVVFVRGGCLRFLGGQGGGVSLWASLVGDG